jgi:hypothetical protein
MSLAKARQCGKSELSLYRAQSIFEEDHALSAAQPGDYVHVDIKLYGLRPEACTVSRLRFGKQRHRSQCYMILWYKGKRSHSKWVSRRKIEKIIAKYNLVEE